MGILQLLIAPVTGIVKSVIEGRQRKQELKHAIHEKKIERVKAGQVAEVEWNTASKKASGWIDDYLTIVLSLPLILSFFPKMVPYIEAGFAALEEAPVWYRAAIAVMISAGFGYKKYADWQMSKHYTLPNPLDKIGD